MDVINTSGVSPHTNRVQIKGVSTKLPIFWCTVCNIKLNSPTHAVQHLSGSSHQSKSVGPNNNSIDTNLIQKRRHDTGGTGQPLASRSLQEEPLPKKNKSPPAKPDISPAPAPVSYRAIICKLCNIELESDATAEIHFKGKKHIKAVEGSKLSSCPAKPQPGNIANNSQKEPGNIANNGQKQPGKIANNCQIPPPGYIANNVHKQHGNIANNHQRQPGNIANNGQKQPGKLANNCQIPPPGNIANNGQKKTDNITNNDQKQPDNIANNGQKKPGKIANNCQIPPPACISNNDQKQAGNVANKKQKTTKNNRKQHGSAETFCEYCNITVNSEDQMAVHRDGIKHKVNAGIIGEPPDEWLMNKNYNQRGRAGHAGSFEGDIRTANKIKNMMRQQSQHGQGIENFNQINSFGNTGGGGERGFIQVHNVFNQTNQVSGHGQHHFGQFGTGPVPLFPDNTGLYQEYDNFAQELDSLSLKKKKGSSSLSSLGRGSSLSGLLGKARGVRRGCFGRGGVDVRGGYGKFHLEEDIRSKEDRGREINSTRGRGPSRGQFNQRGGRVSRGRGNRGPKLPEKVHIHSNFVNDNGTAMIPGGKMKLTSYFVKKTDEGEKKTDGGKSLPPSSKIASDGNKVTDTLSTPTPPADPDTLPLKGILKTTNAVESGKAVVPGAKADLKVPAAAKDKFIGPVEAWPPQEEKAATVPGGKKQLSNYFVSKGTTGNDFFNPDEIARRPLPNKSNIQDDDYLLEYRMNIDSTAYEDATYDAYYR